MLRWDTSDPVGTTDESGSARVGIFHQLVTGPAQPDRHPVQRSSGGVTDFADTGGLPG